MVCIKGCAFGMFMADISHCHRRSPAVLFSALAPLQIWVTLPGDGFTGCCQQNSLFLSDFTLCDYWENEVDLLLWSEYFLDYVRGGLYSTESDAFQWLSLISLSFKRILSLLIRSLLATEIRAFLVARSGGNCLGCLFYVDPRRHFSEFDEGFKDCVHSDLLIWIPRAFCLLN